MKFSVKKEDLLTCLTTIAPAVGSGTILPVLKHIYLEVEEGQVLVRGTNLELYLDAWCEAEVQKPGACCVDSILLQLLATFSDDVILFEKQKTLKISQGDSVYRLPIIDAAEFPVFPDIQEYYTSTSIQPVCDALRRSGIAVATDTSRQALNNYAFDTDHNTIVGADGFRLSFVKNVVLEGKLTTIPNQSLKSIMTLLKSTIGEVELFVGEWFSVKSKNWRVAVNSSVEPYPDYRAIMFQNTENAPSNTVRVSKSELLKKLKVAALFSKRAYDDSRPYQMDVVINATGMLLSMVVEGVVDFEEPINCEVEGEELSICLNPAMLLEAATVVKSETVVLQFYGNDKVFFVSDPDNEDWTYLQMPMVKHWEKDEKREDDF